MRTPSEAKNCMAEAKKRTFLKSTAHLACLFGPQHRATSSLTTARAHSVKPGWGRQLAIPGQGMMWARPDIGLDRVTGQARPRQGIRTFSDPALCRARPKNQTQKRSHVRKSARR